MNFISVFFKKIGNIFYKISLSINSHKETYSIQSKRVEPWFKVDGDHTLRLNYKLDDNSIVFDLGGYKGEWANNIHCKYGCNVIIFEPINKYYDLIKNKFSHNKKIQLFKAGLGARNEKVLMSVAAESTSQFKVNENSTEVDIYSISDFFNNKNISRVDLMKINIEGGEYELLENMVELGLVNKIQNIQVQFHDFIPNAEVRMKKIQSQLAKTHKLTYQYEFVWENWTLK
jgi:FkbM family methyltransferase